MMLPRNARAAVLPALLLALTLAACVNSDAPGTPDGPSTAVQISIDWSDPSVPADARSIRVSASSLDTPERAPAHLVLNHPTTSGSIDAPAGQTRFTIRAYAQPNASGALLHTTQHDMLVIAGQQTTLQVTFPDATRVASLNLSLSATTLRPGGTSVATATARDEHGAIIPGIAVTWTSATPTIASIDDAGVITAHADGQTTITATEPTTSLTATATLTVTTATTTVARLELGPGSGSLPVGARLRFRTEAFDADDQLATDAVITFTSSAPGVMSVTGSGDATALSVGTVTIRATADGVSADATLSITPASSATAGASWGPVRPHVNHTIHAFDARGDTMVASAGRVDRFAPRPHLLMSDDAGTTWRPVYSGSLLDLGCTELDSLTIDPANHTTLFATCGFNDRRLLRSVDGGVRWVVVSQVASGQHPPASFHETDPRFVTAGDTLHSHDRGITWQPTSTLNTRWVSPSDPNRWIDYAPSDPTVTRISYDAGATWSAVSLPPRPDRGDDRCTNEWVWQRSAVSDTGTILALGRHDCFALATSGRYLHVLHASNDAQSWTPRYSETTSSSTIALTSRTLVVSPADDMVLYAFASTVSAASPLYVSQDGGATWSEHTSPVNLSASTRLLSPHLPNALMLRATVGATSPRYVSHDYGATWTSETLGGRYPLLHQRGHRAYAFPSEGSSDQPLVTSDFFQTTDTLPGLGLTTNPAPPSVVPSQTPHAIRSHSHGWHAALQGHYSADRGITWTRTDTPSLLAAQSPTNPDTWYFATYRGDVQRSSNNAATYTYAGTLQNYENVRGFALSHSNANRLYAFNDGGVYRSDNGGQRWRWASTNLTSVWLSDLIVDPTNHDVLYAATLYGIHKSVNGGDDWTLSSSGFPTIVESTVLAITSDGSTVFAGTASGSIYRSLDAGATWEWVNHGFESYRVRDLLVDPNDDNVIYAGTYGGVYKSVDKGSSWTLASAGMFSPFVDWLAIAADSSTIYAGTADHGIYRGTPSSDTGAAFPTAISASITRFAPHALDSPTPADPPSR